VTYKRILVPVDGSPTSMAGLREAIKLARSHRARLALVHVADETIAFNAPAGGISIEPLLEDMRRAGQRLLKRAEKYALAHGIRPESELRESVGARVADAITWQAKRRRADLIVMGTHGRRGVNRMLMGSDAELVVRNASVPVLLVPARRRAGSAGGRKRRK
jgi:nucleotide-binding universal stress UspA family protein